MRRGLVDDLPPRPAAGATTDSITSEPDEPILDGDEAHRNRLVVRALQYADLRALYLQTLEECADSALAVPVTEADATSPEPAQIGWMEMEIARVYDQIREAVALDTTKVSSTDQFEQSVADMKLFARQRGAAVREQVAADRARLAARP